MRSNAGRDAAIVSPLRTPVGKFGGALRDVPADALAALSIRALMERTGLDPARVDGSSWATGIPAARTPPSGG